MKNLLAICRTLKNATDRVIIDKSYFVKDIALAAFVVGLKNFVVVDCFGTKTLWYDREEALRYYNAGVLVCDGYGTESDHYENVCKDIEDGFPIAIDEDFNYTEYEYE